MSTFAPALAEFTITAHPPDSLKPVIDEAVADCLGRILIGLESFNGRFRDELLNGEIFYTLKEAQVVIEQWRKHYNTKRSHSALGYRSPAPEPIIKMDQRPPTP